MTKSTGGATLLNVIEEPTALDLKIARDHFIQEHLEPFWDDLVAAVKGTCERLTAEWPNKHCEHDLNDHNSRIRVTHTPPRGAKSTVEIRFDRKKERLLETAEGTLWLPEAYIPAPDFDNNMLRFKPEKRKRTGDLREFSAVQLAQLVICTHLLKMELPEA